LSFSSIWHKLNRPERPVFEVIASPINVIPAHAEEFDTSKFKELYMTFNRDEVAIIRSILDQAGIRYYCQKEMGDGFFEYLGPVRFFVHKIDVGDATAIFEDFERSHQSKVDPGTEPEVDSNAESPPEPEQTE